MLAASWAPLGGAQAAPDDALAFWLDAPSLPGTVPARLTDASPAGNDGLPANMRASDLSGIVGADSLFDPYALRFDGVDDEVWTTKRYPTPENLTVAFWFRTERAGGKLVGFESQQNGRSGYHDRNVYLHDDGSVRFATAGPADVLATRAGLADGEWHHVVATRDHARGRVALWLDGDRVAEGAAGTPYEYDGYWRLGGGSIWGDVQPRNDHYGGELAGVRIWHRAIADAEALVLHDAGPGGAGAPAGPTPSDLARDLAVRLDPSRPAGEGAVLDTGPYGDDATLDNARGAPSAIERDASLARPSAVVLDGVDDVLTLSRFRDDPDASTVSVWFQTSKAGGKLVGFESQQRGRSGNFDRDLAMGQNGSVSWSVFGNGGVKLWTPPGLADGEWHHVVGVIGSRGGLRGMELWLDGAIMGLDENAEKARYDGYWRVGDGASIGADGGGAFSGRIAGVTIHERALSRDEIRTLHAQGPDALGAPRPTPPGSETMLDGLMLRFDPLFAPPVADRIEDQSAWDNDGLLHNGLAARDGALVFDGKDDLLVTTRHMDAPDAFAITIWFQTTSHGKLIGFESQAAGRSGSFDRHLYLDETGRLHFVNFADDARLVSPLAYNDGEWHQAIATVGSRGGREGMRLFVDGELVAENDVNDKSDYQGYWRVGGGSIYGPDAPARDAYEGRIGPVLVHDRLLAAPEVAATSELGPAFSGGAPAGPNDPVEGPVDPAPEPTDPTAPTEEPPVTTTPPATTPDAPRVRAITKASRVTVESSKLPEGASLYAIDEDGTETRIEGDSFDAPASGWYRVEARSVREDGSPVVLAQDRALVLAPVATPTQALGAAAAGVVVVAGSSVLASRSFDILGYLRRLVMGNAAERFREKTKEVAMWRRIGSGTSFALALVLMAALIAAGRPGALATTPFVEGLLIAGVAVIVYRVVVTTAQYALARVEGVPARYRLWTSGTLSLALSCLVFHMPFGYTGFLNREAAPARPDAKRRAAFASLGYLGAIASVVLVFLALGTFTPFTVAETGITIALGALTVMSMPVKPVAGQKLWAWSKPVSVIVALVGFGAFFAWSMGLLDTWSLVGLGAVGLATFAICAFMNRVAPPAPAA